MGRIINTSSTNTRHEHKYKTSENTQINNNNNNNTSSKQSKYEHTMKFTGLIASTLMLLLAVMASTASARSIAFPEPQYCCNAIEAKCEACKAGVSVEEICRTWVVDSSDPFSYKSRPLPGCPKKPKKCCRANTLECQACNAGVSEEEFCRRNPHSHVCPQKKQCCRAFTLECQACDAGVSEEEFCIRNPHSHVCPQKPTKPSHPDNCYSKIWNKEVMHGEMGAKKCCWKGDWKRKSKCNGGHKDD